MRPIALPTLPCQPLLSTPNLTWQLVEMKKKRDLVPFFYPNMFSDVESTGTGELSKWWPMWVTIWNNFAVQTSQAHKRSFLLYPGIEASHSVHTYLSIPSISDCNFHPHSLPITITNCNDSQKQQREKGVLVQLPRICERCIIVKVVLKKCVCRICRHINTQGNVKQADLGSNNSSVRWPVSINHLDPQYSKSKPQKWAYNQQEQA